MKKATSLWLTISGSSGRARTYNNPVGKTFTMTFLLPDRKKKNIVRPAKPTQRNPILQARQWQNMIHENNLRPADLAKELGISRARVTQVLSFLSLPKDISDTIANLGEDTPLGMISGKKILSLLKLPEDKQREAILRALELKQTRKSLV
jgi:hypothetical protein